MSYMLVKTLFKLKLVKARRNDASDKSRDKQLENTMLRNTYLLLYDETVHAMNFGDVGRCYDCRGSPGLTTFGRVRTCPAGNSGAKTDRVRVSNGRPAKGIH